MSLFKFLGLGTEPAASAAAGTDTVRKIVEQLDDMPADQARFIAGFAYLLSRVARADLSISDDETRAMERIVVEHGNLSEAQAILVIQMAKSQNLLFGGTENYLVAREFGRLASREQKRALLDCVFAVAAADSSISTVEDGVVRQIADELRLEHAEFIEIRRRWRGHLAVLKKPTDTGASG